MGIKLERNIAVEKNFASKTVAKKNFLNQDLSLFSSFNDKKKERFYNDLKVLLTAGVDLKSALEIIIDEQEKEKERVFFESIHAQIIKGKSLSAAMQETGKFSEYEYFSIEIGEEANRLSEILQELMNYYADQAALKRQVMSVLTYPIFVFSITIGLVYFMMTSVVPMFGDVFRQFGSELPPLTKTIVSISEQFPTYMLMAGILIVIISFFVYSQRNQKWFLKGGTSILLRIPKVGYLLKLVYLARFTQTMHLLLSSKTPLVKSLELTNKMIKFYPLQEAIHQMQEDIEKGKALHEGMASFKIFPKRMLSLVKVGEEVNQLEPMLHKLSKQYQEDLKHQTQLIGKLMEPLIILIIGLVVGVILVAMYMPMFNLSNLMTQ